MSPLAYAELHIRGYWVNSRLSQIDLSDDVLVGVLMERSVDVATSLVSIIGARGAYLPHDVRTPIERLQVILQDSAVAALVVNRESAALATGLNAQVPIVVVEERSLDIPEFATTAGSDPLYRLAYVIYTGSPGDPKGVGMLSPRLLRFLGCMQRQLDFDRDDTMPGLAPLLFDVATLQFLLPLFFDGEILHPSLAGRLAPRVTNCWNQCGPTETAIAVATYRVRGDEAMVPIGTAMDGVQLFVLDPIGNPVSEGDAGELFVAGQQLARGYRNRIELAKQRLLIIVVEGEAVRRYRTGDVVN